MAREQYVALLMTSSGFLARRQILADISSKYCKIVNRFRYNISSTEHWQSQCRIRLLLSFDMTPISNCMALMKMYF